MKTQFILAATVALSLTACDGPAKTDAPASDKGAETAKPADAAPTAIAAIAPVAGAFSKDYMIGKWADEKDGDCALAQDFKADGSVDGAFESWSVSGSELHAVMAGEKMVFAVKVVDEKRIDVTTSAGKKSRLVRC